MNPRRGFSNTVQFFEGLGIGLIPLALLFLSLRSNNPLGTVAIILYGVMFVATIVCLAIRRVRFVGYGLLTLVILSPPIAFQIACTVSFQGHL
jgi:hypothetical protein